MLSGEEISLAIKEYVAPLLQAGIDTLILGCTHYPFLSPVIRQISGEEVALVDPATETIEELAELLLNKNLLNESCVGGNREFYVSGNPEPFYKVGRMLLGNVIDKVERITLDGEEVTHA
jgi:glutamate racemase